MTANQANSNRKAFNIETHVEYDTDSVVSKTLLKKSTGSITFFSFDKGQGLSEHTAPFDAVVQVLDGEAEITIDGVKEIVGKGEMIVMPADIPHALYAEKRFKMLLTMIKGE